MSFVAHFVDGPRNGEIWTLEHPTQKIEFPVRISIGFNENAELAAGPYPVATYEALLDPTPFGTRIFIYQPTRPLRRPARIHSERKEDQNDDHD